MKQTEKEVKIREELTRLRNLGNGLLTPRAVVDAAKDENSPMHSEFTWNVNKAADQYWLDQARTLISSYTIIEIRKESVGVERYEIQEYVKDPRIPKDQGYVHWSELKKNPALARLHMSRELATAQAYVNKAFAHAEVLGLGKEVESLLADMANLRAKVTGAGASGTA